jgi:hypothetical protein
VFAFDHTGKLLAGFPDNLQGVVEYYGSAQEFLTEGSSVPSAADVEGDGRDEVAVGPVFSPTYLVQGDGSAAPVYGPAPANAFAQLQSGSLNPLGVAGGNLPTDTPISFTTSGTFGRVGSTLAYAQPGSGATSTAVALLLPGSGFAIKNYERVYQAAGGAPVPGYPAEIQGLDFLGAPIITSLDQSGTGEVVTAGDSSAIEGSGAGGAEVAGFPKFTTGWVLWSPSAGDLLSDGHTDLVAATREGYLMAWRTSGRATANNESWTYHHDEWRTGRYGVDSRPPGAIRRASRNGGRITFTAPGDNWYDGKVADYRVSFAGRLQIVRASGRSGTRQTVTVPSSAGRVTIQAVDHAGNLSPPLALGSATSERPPPLGSSRFTG